jgi:hypothetical protein
MFKKHILSLFYSIIYFVAGVENASSSGIATLTSNSSLSPQRQALLVVNSPIISPLPSESDFQEVDRNNEGIIQQTHL